MGGAIKSAVSSITHGVEKFVKDPIGTATGLVNKANEALLKVTGKISSFGESIAKLGMNVMTGGMPDLSKLVSQMGLGNLSSIVNAGGLDNLVRQLIAQGVGTFNVNGTQIDTGGIANRLDLNGNLSGQVNNIMAQIQAAMGQNASGNATIMPVGSSYNAATGVSLGGASYEAMIQNFMASKGTSNGLTSTQQKLLSDPNLTPEDKAKLTTQFAVQNATDAAEFCSNLAKMMAKPAETIAGNLR